MIEKKLDITEPPINCYPDFACPLSIVLNYESGWNWLYCNFIQLYYDDRHFVNPIRFYYTDINGSLWNTRNPLLNYQLIQRDTFSQFNKDIIEFILDSIDLNNYITLSIDEYYIPDRRAYNKFHYPHSIFIYGYNKEKEFFDTSGYNQRFQYINQEISFKELRDSYLNNVNQYWYDNNYICLMQFDKKRKKFELDVTCIIEQLEEYLYSRNSSSHYRNMFNDPNLYFGMDIYNQLKSFYNAVHEYNWNFNINKPIYLLAEHKKLMAQRILYLENKNIVSDCKEIYNFFNTSAEELSNHLVYLLKYKVKRKKEFIDNILSLIDNLVIQEKTYIDDLINKLKQYTQLKKYSANVYYSNSKILQSIIPLEKKYTGIVKIQLDILLPGDQIEGVIGFSDDCSIINIVNVIPVQLRMNNDGFFDAINKDIYANTELIIYRANIHYHLDFIIDIEKKQYSIELENETGIKKTIAYDFSFSTNAPTITNIGRIMIYANSIEKISAKNIEFHGML